jgi:predicted tellurium resistance membrane protein TerC
MLSLWTDAQALFTFESLVALLTLSGLEIALGIDNLVVLSIITGKLPAEQQPLARRLGLLGAMFTRIGLLFTLSWFAGMTDPLVNLGKPFSGRDLVLLVGGLYLIWKGTTELHERIDEPRARWMSQSQGLAYGKPHGHAAASMFGAIVQIAIIDIVFSLDSVITAVGMAQHIVVMVAAIVVAILVMMLFSGWIARVIEKHPTLKVLALAFILLVGVFLVVDAMGAHVEKAYLYFAMAFSLGVEMVNISVSRAHSKYPRRED